MMAGKGDWAGRRSKTVLPGLGVTKVSELPGDQVSPAEGKCLLGEGAPSVRGHVVNHIGRELRRCHMSSAREVPLTLVWDGAVLRAFWALSSHYNMPHKRASFGSLLRESLMKGLWEGQSGMKCSSLLSFLLGSSVSEKEGNKT